MVNVVIGITLLVVSMGLYLVTMGKVLPNMLLRAEFLPVPLSARGSRRCFVNGKRCVVYERSLSRRQYISHYLLIESEGCKLLKCKVTPLVRQMEYDVVLYNRYNRVFDIVHVRETLGAAYTKLLRLPAETSYAEIRLRKVNRSVISSGRVAKIRWSNVFLFGFLAVVITIIESLAIMAGASYAFGSVFREDLIQRINLSLIIVTALSIVIGLLITLVTVFWMVKGRHEKLNEGLDK